MNIFSIQDTLLGPLLRSCFSSTNKAEKVEDMNKLKQKIKCMKIRISIKQNVEVKELIELTKDRLNWNLRTKEWKIIWRQGAAPQDVLKILMSYLFLIDQMSSVEYTVGLYGNERTYEDSDKHDLKQPTT